MRRLHSYGTPETFRGLSRPSPSESRGIVLFRSMTPGATGLFETKHLRVFHYAKRP